MSHHRYTADVALTSEGNALAMLHEQILFFETIKDLDEYIERLTKHRDLVVNKIVPLDDQTVEETDEYVADDVEKFLTRLRKPRKESPNGAESTVAIASEERKAGEMTHAFREFFKKGGWEIEEETEGLTIKILVKGKNGNWVAHALPFEDRDQALFVSICPVTAPEPKRASIAEFITRANFGMKIGNFEMGYEHGDIRYKTSIDVEGTRLIYPLVRQLVVINLETMDRYLPGIIRVIETDMPPEDAINMVEGDNKPWQ